MRKLISVFILSVIIVVLSCGIGDAADTAGVRITSKTPQHGHQNMYDGGVLKLDNTTVYSSVTLTVGPTEAKVILWNTETIDTLSTHSTVTNTGRFTVPVGYNYLRLNCTFRFAAIATPTYLLIDIIKNTTSYFTPDNAIYHIPQSSYATSSPLHTYWLPVTAGDYVEIEITNGDTVETLTLIQDTNSCSAEFRR